MTPLVRATFVFAFIYCIHYATTGSHDLFCLYTRTRQPVSHLWSTLHSYMSVYTSDNFSRLVRATYLFVSIHTTFGSGKHMWTEEQLYSTFQNLHGTNIYRFAELNSNFKNKTLNTFSFKLRIFDIWPADRKYKVFRKFRPTQFTGKRTLLLIAENLLTFHSNSVKCVLPP